VPGRGADDQELLRGKVRPYRGGGAAGEVEGRGEGGRRRRHAFRLVTMIDDLPVAWRQRA
jgi:hypothetical protein